MFDDVNKASYMGDFPGHTDSVPVPGGGWMEIGGNLSYELLNAMRPLVMDLSCSSAMYKFSRMDGQRWPYAGWPSEQRAGYDGGFDLYDGFDYWVFSI